MKRTATLSWTVTSVGVVLALAVGVILWRQQPNGPDRCPIRGIDLDTVVGYFPGGNSRVSAAWDYVEFMGVREHLYPYAASWAMSNVRRDIYTKRRKTRICPECDRQLNEDYSKFKALSKDDRARMLRESPGPTERNPAEQAASSNP
jgi:hypothetical protein